ncbi:MAG: tRNA (N6-isopentenyl adenosine(37)-C2)-methylthiotransferase MiaB [Bacteroidetes bacterium]|nr:tRNA (N6-isopentenyl adenosine(37)-C2)-methylthiotransferase MiaB [Bacteroidota bacterium]
MTENKIRKFYIETYGCQMNFSDSEIVASILTDGGFQASGNLQEADIVLLNTCSIREHAEDRVRKRLHYFRSLKKKNPGLTIGLLGCMAERTKFALMEEEQLLDVIAGPDSYRHLPGLLEQAGSGQRAIDTILSADETYADINPVRLDSNGISSFISIMRGCENFCSYCVVPYARGQERSRDPETVIRESRDLFIQGYREVTLLGQNVNSYFWKEGNETVNFPGLLERIAVLDPQLRVRFATSHPKDLSLEVIEIIEKYPNICKAIHLPVQSGSDKILDKMNRKYTREEYLGKIRTIRSKIPGCAISTDIITGFCDETEEDHKQTLELMKEAAFDFAFTFKYSERPQTIAAEQYEDNVPAPVKERRLREIIELQQELSSASNHRDLGETFEVLIEGESKRSDKQYFGRNSQNKVMVFPKTSLKPGEYVKVKVKRVTSATLIGEAI